MVFAYLPDAVMAAWPKLSLSAKAVVVAMASFMSKEGRCFPSREKLSERSGIRTLSVISKAIKELERAGLITIRRRHNTSSVYHWVGQQGVPPNGQQRALLHSQGSVPLTIPLQQSHYNKTT